MAHRCQSVCPHLPCYQGGSWGPGCPSCFHPQWYITHAHRHRVTRSNTHTHTLHVQSPQPDGWHQVSARGNSTHWREWVEEKKKRRGDEGGVNGGAGTDRCCQLTSVAATRLQGVWHLYLCFPPSSPKNHTPAFCGWRWWRDVSLEVHTPVNKHVPHVCTHKYTHLNVHTLIYYCTPLLLSFFLSSPVLLAPYSPLVFSLPSSSLLSFFLFLSGVPSFHLMTSVLSLHPSSSPLLFFFFSPFQVYRGTNHVVSANTWTAEHKWPQPPPCEYDPGIKAFSPLLLCSTVSVRVCALVCVCLCECCQAVLVIILDRRNYRLLQKRACGCSSQSHTALKGLWLSKSRPIISSTAHSCLLNIKDINRENKQDSKLCYSTSCVLHSGGWMDCDLHASGRLSFCLSGCPTDNALVRTWKVKLSCWCGVSFSYDLMFICHQWHKLQTLK